MKRFFVIGNNLLLLLVLGICSVALVFMLIGKGLLPEPGFFQSAIPTSTFIPVVLPTRTPTTLPTFTLPPPPTKIPPDFVPAYTGTPPTVTPRPDETRSSVFISTPTPFPISKVTDLAVDLPDEMKSVYIIKRVDGSYEKFLIPGPYTGDVRVLMRLAPDDVIINHYPLIAHPSTPVVTPLPCGGKC
jgi:hypothetical protein